MLSGTSRCTPAPGFPPPATSPASWASPAHRGGRLRPARRRGVPGAPPGRGHGSPAAPDPASRPRPPAGAAPSPIRLPSGRLPIFRRSPAPPGSARSARRSPPCGTPTSATPIPMAPRSFGSRSGDYLGRVRGVVSDAGRVVITSGWCQGRSLVWRALVAGGARRVAIEDPCHDEVRMSVAERGAQLVPLPVDGEGLRVDGWTRRRSMRSRDAGAPVPDRRGALGARRGALLDWLRRTGGSPSRTTTTPSSATTGRRWARCRAWTPSASSTPARRARRSRRRCGWAGWWCRRGCWTRCSTTAADGLRRVADRSARLCRLPLPGELDRHLRRMRVRYRARRDALVEALSERCRKCGCTGSGGPARRRSSSATATRQADPGRGTRRGVALTAMSDYYHDRTGDSSMLLLGYGRFSEAGIRDRRTGAGSGRPGDSARRRAVSLTSLAASPASSLPRSARSAG